MSTAKAKFTTLELKLNDIFVTNAPTLPKGLIKFFVDIAPWAALLSALGSIWTIYTLWHWTHIANLASNYANQLSQIYGTKVVGHRLSFMIWLSIITIIIQAVVYFLALSPLRAHKKAGWDLLFYAALIVVVYNVLVLFTTYGTFGNFIGSVIGIVISFYILFQIRASYMSARDDARVETVQLAKEKPAKKPKI